MNRLDYGKKYCHHSPSIEESPLQDAVMRAIMQTAKQNVEVLKILKIHIGMGLTDEVTEDRFSPYLMDCKIIRWSMTISSSVRSSNV